VTFPRFNLLVVCLAGWLTQQQNDIIDFLLEENRTLHDLLGKQRLRLNNQQRRRLAAKAKPISRKVLERIQSAWAVNGAVGPESDRSGRGISASLYEAHP
jgi:hypothetical protein